MLARLVLAPLAKLRFGLTGHVGVVIGGVEEQAISGRCFDLPDALEKSAGYRVQIGFAHPIPFFPVAFAGEFVQFDRPYMLDGCLPKPIGKFVFTDGLYHPVQHAIEKILADRRPPSPFLL